MSPERFPGEAHTALSDGYPLLLLSEASLEALNERLERPLPRNRFRPNLVVRGCAPFAEDGWKRIGIGDVLEPGMPVETVETQPPLFPA